MPRKTILFWQALNDANWLVYTGIAFDCIHDYLTVEERKQIADGAYHADNVAPSLLGGMTFIRAFNLIFLVIVLSVFKKNIEKELNIKNTKTQ